MIKCTKCRMEIAYEKNAMYIGTTGERRKQPLCVYCHEEAVRGAGRSAAKVSRYYSEPSEYDADSNGDEAQWAFWYEHPQFRIQGLD